MWVFCCCFYSDAAPSAEPTAMPTAPSARPTARPTTRPTVATTAFPTAAAPAVVSFKAVQTVSGISITQFNTNPTLYTTTLKQSIAATMDGVTENDFSSFVVTAGNTRVSSGLRRAFSSRRLQTSSIVATYTVQTTSLLTAEDLEDQLTNAVTSGDFNSILQTTAAINNATDLENATSESVEVESADGGSSNDDLSGGAIAGIVIGVVVGTVLIAMIIYYFAFMGGSFTSVNGGEAHVEL